PESSTFSLHAALPIWLGAWRGDVAAGVHAFHLRLPADGGAALDAAAGALAPPLRAGGRGPVRWPAADLARGVRPADPAGARPVADRKSTRLNSSHVKI